MGAGEGGLQGTVRSDDGEMNPVEVCANGVEVCPTRWTLFAWKFHSCLSETKGTVCPLDFVLDYTGEDNVLRQAFSELYFIVFYLD